MRPIRQDAHTLVAADAASDAGKARSERPQNLAPRPSPWHPDRMVLHRLLIGFQGRLAHAATAAVLAASALLVVPSFAWAKVRSVRVDVANFREGPSTKHDVIFVADRYYPVDVLEEKDGWAKVKDFEGDEAWIAGWLLDDTNTAVVTVNLANLRAKPSLKGEVVHQAERGAVFKVVARRKEWVKVEHVDGDSGWIHGKLLWGLERASSKAPKGKESPKKAAPKDKKSDKGKGKGSKGEKKAQPEKKAAEPSKATKPKSKPAK